MSARATNLAILVLLVVELASGVGSYLAGAPTGAGCCGRTASAGSASSC